MAKITDAEVKDLADAIAKSIKSAGIGGGGGSPASSSAANVAAGAAGKSLNVFDIAVQGAGKGVDAMKSAYDKVAGEVSAGMGTWRDFTKSGISFNNDIIGMTVAAKGARVDLGEFAQTIKDNQVNLAGFGGGIGEGAKSFAALSKKMFDAGEATDSLRQLGYTNKELNDVLALQAGMIGSSMRKGAEKDEIAIAAATTLAQEMDMMAKLTGKSRESQLESQKKLAADAAFNAKLDQATRNMGEKEAAEYRSKIMAEYTKSEAIGLGQSFKETFTYGQVMSKGAANEQAIAGKAGVEVARGAQAAAAGNFEESARRMSNAQDEAIKNNKSANFQNLVIFGQFSGAAGESAQKQYMANKAMTDTIKALEKEPENRGKSEAELRKIAMERIKTDQETSAGSTKAAVNVEQRMKDLSSVIGTSLIDPLNKQVNPELNKFADAVMGARSSLVKGGPEKGVAKAMEDEIAAGRKQATDGKDRPKGLLQGTGYVAEKGGEIVAGGIGVVNQAAEKLGDKVQKRQGGSLDMAGKLFENWGQGTLVELHGLEGVVRPDDMKKILSSSMGGIGEVLKSPQQSMPINMPEIKMPEFKTPSLDISKISKDISTTISSVSGGKETTTKGPDMREMSNSMAKMGMKDDQKKVFDEIMTLTDQQSKEKILSLKEETAAAYAANKASSAAIDAMEDKLEAEGRHIKDLTAEERKKYDELRTQQNESYDNINKSISATKAAEHAEKQKQSLQKLGYDVEVKQEEDKVKIIETNAEKIKADISDALPVKEVAAKQQEFQSQFSESQQKIIDDYKGYSEENRSFHAQAMEAGVKEDTETAQMIGARISKMKADIGDRQATEEEAAALANEEANKKLFEKRVVDKKEMLDVMQNLEEYSAKRELELKQKSLDDVGAVKSDSTDTIKTDINDALPIDTEFGDLEGAMKYAQSAPYDEFAGVDEAVAEQSKKSSAMSDLVNSTSPTTSQQSGRGPIDPNSFTLGPNGLPIPKPKSTAAAMPNKPAEKQASPGKKINPETGEEYTPVEELAKQQGETASKSKPAAGGDNKGATLDDLLKSMNALNTKIGQLITTSESGYASIARSAKANSNNLYERAKA